MSTLSNEFHGDLDMLKADFEKLLTRVEAGLATALSDVKTVLTNLIDQAGPVLLAAAAAGVNAALTTTTGGLGAIAEAEEAAALAVLSTQGVSLAENAALQLKTLVLTNVLKANSSPTTPANS